MKQIGDAVFYAQQLRSSRSIPESKMSKTFSLLGSVVFFTLLFSGVSEATNWKICNKTAETMWAAIASDPGTGGYVSQGWWKLAPCGGCARVGSFGLRGVWYRAHNQDNTRLIEGDDLFCTTPRAFRLDNQAACHVPGNTSLAAQGFRSVILSGNDFTSNINGRAANGSVCID